MNKSLSNFKRTHQLGFRALKLTHQMNENLLPVLIIGAILQAAAPYIGIVLSARVIDNLLTKQYQKASLLAILMVSLTFVVQVLEKIISSWASKNTAMLVYQLKVKVREKTMSLDYESMQDPKVIEKITSAEQMMNYNGGLNQIINTYKAMLRYILSTITAIVFTVMLCLSRPEHVTGLMAVLTNPWITAGFLICIWLLSQFTSKRQTDEIKKEEDEINNEHYKVENRLGYWINKVFGDTQVGKTIRLNGMEDVVFENLVTWIKGGRKVFEKMGVVELKTIKREALVNSIFGVAAYLVVILKVTAKAVSIGSFTQYSGALLQFNEGAGKIIWSQLELNRFNKVLEPLFDVFDRKNKMESGSLNVEKRLDHEYEIEFHDVSFKYPGTNQYILRHINYKLNMKDKIAVVGMNGTGKTTFIKLLCRMYDPTEGCITLNGIDIRKYNYEEYLNLFGVVFQDYHLFGFALAENVAASVDYDEVRLKKVLEQAGIYDRIMEMPHQLMTNLDTSQEEGVNFSGGETQKIALARALYKDAPFVILDEPTAALDPISESEIYEKFNEMVEDKTSVYISHRMSSCRFCNEILVFGEGGILERGSHEKLLVQNGKYAELWNSQAKYYQENSLEKAGEFA